MLPTKKSKPSVKSISLTKDEINKLRLKERNYQVLNLRAMSRDAGVPEVTLGRIRKLHSGSPEYVNKVRKFLAQS